MTLISVGDAALTNVLSRQGADLRAQVQRASVEVATGRPADLAATMRGDLGQILAIDASLTRMAGFRTAAVDLSTVASAQQSAVRALSGLVTDITMPLLSAQDVSAPVKLSTLATDARGRLESAIGLINAWAGGRAVFSGMESDRLPLGSAPELLNALQLATLGSTTAGQVAAAVSNWFASPAGYGAFYQGGAPAAPVSVAPEESAGPGATALDPAIVDTLTGLAMAALLDLGVLSGDAEEQGRLAARAGQALLASEDGRVALSARIGALEAQIERARSRNSAEETALGILRSEIGAVDPYEAATRLEAARNQLEAIYLVTARVSRLSLVEFLR